MNGRLTTLQHRVRIAIIFGLFLCFLGIVELRLYTLQCLSFEKYNKAAQNLHIKKITFEPQRGWIYDRNGNPLATSVEFFALIASPKDIAIQKKEASKKKKSIKKDLDIHLARELAPIVGMSSKTLLDTLTRDTSRAWLVLKKEITVEQSQLVDQICQKYRLRNEISVEPVAKRIYPKGDLACHVLGPVGLGHPEMLSSGWGSHRALGGLELKRQEQVSGSFGLASSLQDRGGRSLTPLDENIFLAIAGDQLYVTLDEVIQHVAESELEKTIEKFKARSGCIIVMDPNTGEILAMANYPKYNLDNYRKIRKENWRFVSLNRAVEVAFEPGSTMKIFTAAAALAENKVRMTEVFDGHNGRIKFAGRILRDTHAYKSLTFPQIIEVSSNIGIHQVAERLGSQTLYQHISDFGFGKPTGIELPGETPGVVQPLRAWKPLVLSRVSFGQSISASALQMTCAVSVIANGGTLFKPHIVKSIHDSQGKLIKKYEPEPIRQVLEERVANTMKEIMEGVVIRGTGQQAAIPNFRVGGKTGTAQVYNEGGRGYKPGKYLSSFIGFLPVESPRLVIGVFIDEPSQGGHYGSTVASPAFRNVAEAALNQLGIHPTVPENLQVVKGNWKTDHSNTDIEIKKVNLQSIDLKIAREDSNDIAENLMPGLQGLTKRAAMILLSNKGLKIKWQGSGVVVAQFPKEGAKISDGDSCHVVLMPEETLIVKPKSSELKKVFYD